MRTPLRDRCGLRRRGVRAGEPMPYGPATVPAHGPCAGSPACCPPQPATGPAHKAGAHYGLCADRLWPSTVHTEPRPGRAGLPPPQGVDPARARGSRASPRATGAHWAVPRGLQLFSHEGKVRLGALRLEQPKWGSRKHIRDLGASKQSPGSSKGPARTTSNRMGTCRAKRSC